MMATTASSAANSASRFSIDSSISRSRHGDSSPWLLPSDSHDHPTLSLSQDDPFSAPSVSPPTGNNSSDYDNADKKPPPVWNMPSSNSSSDVGPVMGAAESWPALSLSARSSSIKSPSLDASKPFPDGSSSSIPPPQATSNTSTNANAGSSVSATSSENSAVNNSQRKPFRRNNNTSSSSTSSNVSNAAPLNTRDQNHSQRGGGSFGSGNFRNSQRNRNSSSYPRGEGLHHGNRRNYEHGNQSGFSHRNYSGRDMHLQPQRGVGMIRPQMLMGPPSFPASSAQYMAAPQLGSYGGPTI